MCYFGDSTRPPGFRNNFKTFYSFGWNNGCDEARRAVMLLPFQLCACVEQHTLLLGCYCQRAALPANDDRTKRINCAKWYKFSFSHRNRPTMSATALPTTMFKKGSNCTVCVITMDRQCLHVADSRCRAAIHVHCSSVGSPFHCISDQDRPLSSLF
jgi:hypothetical protein